MKKITFFIAFGLFTLIGNAQTFQWAKQIAGTTASAFSVNIKDLRPIGTGHVFVCGSFSGTVDFDPSSGTNFKTAQGTDGFVGQYDSGGNLLWLYTTNQSGDEEAKGLCINSDFLPSKLISVFQQGTNSFFLRSFTISDGTIFSTSSIYSATGTVNITSLNALAQLDAYMVGGSYSGSITVDGQTRTSAGQQDGFVAKFQSNGSSAASAFEFGWLKSYGGTGNDQVNSVTFYGLMSCVGYFENTADFDGDPLTSSILRTSAGGKDCFKLDLDYSNGNTQTTIAFGSTGDDSVSAICDTDAGIISGYFSNTLPVDPTDVDNNLVSSGGKDGFIIRYSGSTYFWAQKIGGTNDDEIVSLSKASANVDVYYAAKLGSVSGSATTIGSYSSATGVVTSFGGIFLPNNQTTLNAPLRIAQDLNTSIGVFTSGVFNATTDFNPQTGTASITPISGGNNGFIQKMSPCSNSAETPTISGNNSVCLGQSITLSVGNSATLRDNNEWKWYSDSCGGTLVGTGFTLAVSPNVQTTYYVRGEGGCVPNGNCSAGKTVSIITNLPSDAVTISGNTLTATQASATYQWIDCNNGNSDIAGATSRSYTPTVSGNYAVRVTNSSGCTVTSNCTVLTICNPATNPQITGSANAICAGESRTLTATGNLNQSLEWKWYTGTNCGQTLIGTGASITVSPTVTTAYYCRGEGGCSQDGLCRTVNVQVNAVPSNVVSQTGNILTAQESGATYQWIDCTNGNSDISGATSQSYTPTVSGNYAVKITSANGCLVTSSCTQITLSIQEFEQLGIKLYPNPIKNHFTLVGEEVINRVTIYNLLGQKVKEFSGNQSYYDVNDLSSGTFIIEVVTEKGKAKTKIIKE
ncbi:T9SS type A sorting domain-containing protein [Flavobacterium sp. AS60]|uniref:T9SS type A sorting domain-containing protein n=1 Tax=Flavobacterium anseongense TaxID=2910677 RepID=UPI001F3520AB|nr:T9SS type A sorting domain-containing protein [Flavobacterium sp. AS60]MCF6130114.1 T9SS type A sorting domain-containing protein [Flavobacterium sp. AS60]